MQTNINDTETLKGGENNTRIERITGTISAEYSDTSKNEFSIIADKYNIYYCSETLDQLNKEYNLNLQYGDKIIAECEIYSYECWPVEVSEILSIELFE